MMGRIPARFVPLMRLIYKAGFGCSVVNAAILFQTFSRHPWAGRVRERRKRGFGGPCSVIPHPVEIESRCAVDAALESVLAVDFENDSKPRLAAHHVFVGLGRAFQWEDFRHRPNACEHAEGKGILRIDGRAGRPSEDRAASHEEWNCVHFERVAGRSENDQLPVDAQAAQRRAHRFATRYGGQDYLGAAHPGQLRDHILCPTVNVLRCAKLAGQRFFVPAPCDGNGPETHLRGVLNAQMAESSHAEYGDRIAGARATVPKGIEGGDAPHT